MTKIDSQPEGGSRPEPERSGIAWLPLAAAATLVLLVWSGWSQVQLRLGVQDLQVQNLAQANKLASLHDDLKQARERLGTFSKANRILATPGLETIRLAGLEAAPEASALALVAADGGRAVFYASNLAQVNDNQCYQLWIIAAGKPVPAGVFTVDKSGAASVILDKLAAGVPIEAWAVTIEPAGGVPQPTGPMVLMGAAA